MKAVIFTGEKKNGKTTAADVLLDQGYEKFSFADPLKKLLMHFFRLDKKYFYDQEFKEVALDLTEEQSRLASFILNNDWIEEYLASFDHKSHVSDVRASHLPLSGYFQYLISRFSDDSFVDQSVTPRKLMQVLGTDVFRKIDSDFWLKVAESNLIYMKKVVFDDIRFKNEVELIQQTFDGGVVVYKIKNPNVKKDENVHASEAGFDVEGQIVISNDGSLAEFKEKIKNLSL